MTRVLIYSRVFQEHRLLGAVHPDTSKRRHRAVRQVDRHHHTCGARVHGRGPPAIYHDAITAITS